MNESHKEVWSGCFCPAEIILAFKDARLNLWLRIRSFHQEGESGKHGWAWPSNNFLAKEIGLTEAYVKDKISQMVQEGYLARQFNKDKGNRRELRAIVPNRATLVGAKKSAPGGAKKSAPRGGENSSPIEDTKEKDQLELIADAPPRRKKQAADYTADFTEGPWKILPQGSKSRAFAKWQKTPPLKRKRILERLVESVKACESIGRIHRDLSAWLNERGWEDDYDAMKKAWSVDRKKSSQAKKPSMLEKYTSIPNWLWKELKAWQATEEQLAYLNSHWEECRSIKSEFISTESWWEEIKARVAVRGGSR